MCSIHSILREPQALKSQGYILQYMEERISLLLGGTLDLRLSFSSFFFQPLLFHPLSLPDPSFLSSPSFPLSSLPSPSLLSFPSGSPPLAIFLKVAGSDRRRGGEGVHFSGLATSNPECT